MTRVDQTLGTKFEIKTPEENYKMDLRMEHF